MKIFAKLEILLSEICFACSYGLKSIYRPCFDDWIISIPMIIKVLLIQKDLTKCHSMVNVIQEIIYLNIGLAFSIIERIMIS